ncbi:DUF3667 domain-containing protein [Flavobacterium sp. TAB 87]|uniref:DUF3667 domain-containing protein n=1 Tax=Flavobacterium sp. TAB 87 TaxID=1729581 RepID=UPI00076D6ACB|nr:DUF3667 domain-containing protein [Flavobacterium sp. TAB 87]KVV14029.1 hypothetical protein AP058_01914 [Flavobacterium sp. TAB 87]
MNCKNCNIEIDSKFCPDCGEPTKLKRIDGLYIIHEIKHVLHFEKGILYTIKELLLNPGENIRHFINENRVRLVKPIIFIIITSLIYTLINHFFQLEDGYVKFDGDKLSTTNKIFNWVQAHYGYANIIIGIFIAFWIKIFFKRYGYNFFEILILLCFIMGMQMLIFSLSSFLEGLTTINMMQFGSIIGLIYIIWAIGQFFEEKKFSNYLKAFASYFLGMICATLFALAIGAFVDIFIKQ